MKNKLLLSLSVLGMSFLTVNAYASEFNANQKKEIESIVKDYLLKNPEILIDVSNELEKKKQDNMDQTIVDNAKYFLNSKDYPTIGDSKSKHYIIEFFDYNCGYCKISHKFAHELAKEKKARVVFVEYPVISKESVKASVVAMAIYQINKDKYFEFQNYFMGSKEKIVSESQIKDAVKSLGLSWDEIQKVVESKKPQQILSDNILRGRNMDVLGTPFYIVDGTPIRGAVGSKEDLESYFK